MSTTSVHRISLIEQLLFFDQQNHNRGIDAIVLSLICSVFGQETSFEFNWIHPTESLMVIWLSCSEKFCEELDNNNIVGHTFLKSSSFRFETI